MRAARLVALALVAAACAGGPTAVPGSSGARLAGRGPYHAGVTTLNVDGTPVEVWYPARASDRRPERTDPSTWIPAATRRAIESRQGPAPRVPTPAARSAPAARGPFPLVIFVHGFGGARTQSADLTAHLATRGAVVLAPDFPGMRAGTPVASADFAPESQVALVERATQALADAAATDGPLRHLVDGPRVDAVTGHSAGATTALVYAARHPTTRATVALAGAARADQVPPSARTAPALFVVGDADGVTDEDELHRYAAAGHGPAALLTLGGVGHLDAMTDLCVHGAGFEPMARWLDLPDGLARLGDDGCGPPGPAPRRGRALVRAALVAELRARGVLPGRVVHLRAREWAAAFGIPVRIDRRG